MKVIITGSTGMIGELILKDCLKSDKISDVRSLVRKPTGLKHQKLNEIIIHNFEDFSEHLNLFQDINIAFFCIGVYTGQVSNELFKKITVNYAVKFANALKLKSPDSTICLLSGAGADLSEKSKTSFAKYKGMAENQISSLDLNFYSFRPAYIYPVTQREEPNLMYRILRFIYPIIKIFGESTTIKSTELAQAMFNVGISGADKKIIENKEIHNYINFA